MTLKRAKATKYLIFKKNKKIMSINAKYIKKKYLYFDNDVKLNIFIFSYFFKICLTK